MAGYERFEDAIGGWLEESAPVQLPGRVLDATFERTRRTRQEPAWRAVLGRTQMPRFVPALAGAAVIVLAAVLVLNFTAILGPAGSPSPASTQPGTQAPSTTPSSSEATALTPDEWGCVDPADAGGTYRSPVGGISVTATVPSDSPDSSWRGKVDGFQLVSMPCLFSSDRTIMIAPITSVPSDACHWRSTDVATSTPAEVVAALTTQAGHETVGPVQTTLGGRVTSRFEFTWSAGLDIETCDGDLRLTGWTGGEGLNGPESDVDVRFYVVEVDGQAIGVRAGHAVDTTEDRITELDTVLDSLRFER